MTVRFVRLLILSVLFAEALERERQLAQQVTGQQSRADEYANKHTCDTEPVTLGNVELGMDMDMTAEIATTVASTAATTATTYPFARPDDGLDGFADPTFGLNVPTCGSDPNIVPAKDGNHFEMLRPTPVETPKEGSHGSTPTLGSLSDLSDLVCADL